VSSCPDDPARTEHVRVAAQAETDKVLARLDGPQVTQAVHRYYA
jgi:hypothetical protein